MGWIIAFLIGALVGWVVAHSVVATECERLGSFYVGKKTFHCVKVTPTPSSLKEPTP